MTSVSRFVFVAGTRPEFVKLHPVALAAAERHMELALITTEQHTGSAMRDDFLERLEWPCPVERLDIDTRAPLPLLAGILTQLGDRLRQGDALVAVGDTTSVLGASLVANKLRLRLAHVEAGLRSYDLRMPEEYNRRMCDHLADDLFAPTGLDARHLAEERCPGRSHVVGNTVMDAVRLNAGRLPSSTAFGSGYVLLTIHRQENLDDPAFVSAVATFLERTEQSCVFPIHPRTRDAFARSGLLARVERRSNVRVCEPLDYLTFLAAMRDARVILTDSGGVQEEATAPAVRRPVIVLRRSTERVAAIEAHFSVLAPFHPTRIAELTADLSWFKPAEHSPFGDGHAASRIVEILINPRDPAGAADRA